MHIGEFIKAIYDYTSDFFKDSQWKVHAKKFFAKVVPSAINFREFPISRLLYSQEAITVLPSIDSKWIYPIVDLFY